MEWKPDNFAMPSEEDLRKSLSPLAYKVTRKDGTEPPFEDPLWDNKKPGIYVDVISGEPLFSSQDKYDSGTGWPSFTRPIAKESVTTRRDFKLLLPRTEVRSSLANSHLGHVFSDGPAPTGQRYCMNAAAMRFVPLEDMQDAGYGAWIPTVTSEGQTDEDL